LRFASSPFFRPVSRLALPEFSVIPAHRIWPFLFFTPSLPSSHSETAFRKSPGFFFPEGSLRSLPAHFDNISHPLFICIPSSRCSPPPFLAVPLFCRLFIKRASNFGVAHCGFVVFHPRSVLPDFPAPHNPSCPQRRQLFPQLVCSRSWIFFQPGLCPFPSFSWFSDNFFPFHL